MSQLIPVNNGVRHIDSFSDIRVRENRGVFDDCAPIQQATFLHRAESADLGRRSDPDSASDVCRACEEYRAVHAGAAIDPDPRLDFPSAWLDCVPAKESVHRQTSECTRIRDPFHIAGRKIRQEKVRVGE
jgi:hypothetical protein